jgi:hypothetical protein
VKAIIAGAIVGLLLAVSYTDASAGELSPGCCVLDMTTITKETHLGDPRGA